MKQKTNKQKFHLSVCVEAIADIKQHNQQQYT